MAYEQVSLNGAEVWAFVVDLSTGLRMQLAIDDWERMGISPGQPVAVCRLERFDEVLYLAEAVVVPPVVWVVLAQRMRAAG